MYRSDNVAATEYVELRSGFWRCTTWLREREGRHCLDIECTDPQRPRNKLHARRWIGSDDDMAVPTEDLIRNPDVRLWEDARGEQWRITIEHPGAAFGPNSQATVRAASHWMIFERNEIRFGLVVPDDVELSNLTDDELSALLAQEAGRR
jgi:hypothetical protein